MPLWQGICFITYESQEGVDAALKFDGDDYGGRTLKAEPLGSHLSLEVKLASDKLEKGKGGKDGKGKGKNKGKVCCKMIS